MIVAHSGLLVAACGRCPVALVVTGGDLGTGVGFGGGGGGGGDSASTTLVALTGGGGGASGLGTGTTGWLLTVGLVAIPVVASTLVDAGPGTTFDSCNIHQSQTDTSVNPPAAAMA